MKENLSFFVAAVESTPILGLSLYKELNLVRKVESVAQAPLTKKLLPSFLVSLLVWAAWKAVITSNWTTLFSLSFTHHGECRMACLRRWNKNPVTMRSSAGQLSAQLEPNFSNVGRKNCDFGPQKWDIKSIFHSIFTSMSFWTSMFYLKFKNSKEWFIFRLNCILYRSLSFLTSHETYLRLLL